MVLSMPSPYKHPKTGVYWYRQRVPASLGALAKGKTVTVTLEGKVTTPKIGSDIKVSLGTKEPKVAKQRAKDAQDQFDLIWASFDNAPVHLTLRQCVALSGEMYRLYKSFEDEPEAFAHLAERKRQADEERARWERDARRGLKIRQHATLQERWGTWVDGALSDRHLRVDEQSYQNLLREFERAYGDAAALLERRAGGDFGPDTTEQRFPEVELPVPTQTPKPAAEVLTLTALLDHKQKTQSQKARTYTAYRSCIKNFAAFVGHEDARRVTRDNIREWRNHLMGSGLSTKTINDKYLTSLKAALSHGEEEFGIANPAAGIRDKRDGQGQIGKKDYTPEQAKRILGATFLGSVKGLSIPHQRAVFWVPWIMAYTGLRVSEVTQFRGRNLRWDGDTPYMLITPEDGSTKNGAAWAVGIHRHLIDLGLLDMLKAVGDGPAFYTPYLADVDLRALKDHRAKDAATDVGDWILTALGEPAPLNRPSHAWRHTFTTLSRGLMDKEARDFMMGSRSKVDAREGYGEWPPAVLDREINKLPRFVVEESAWRPSNAPVAPTPMRSAPPVRRARRRR